MLDRVYNSLLSTILKLLTLKQFINNIANTLFENISDICLFIPAILLNQLGKAKKKNMCVYGPPTDPNFWSRMALLVENYLNTLFLHSNAVFDV